MDTTLDVASPRAAPEPSRALARSVTQAAALMAGLGLARFAPRAAGWASEARAWLAYGPPRPSGWAALLRDTNSAAFAWHAWPLAMALLLLVLGWPSLLLGASLSFLFLAADELAALGLHWAWGVELSEAGWAPRTPEGPLALVGRASYAGLCLVAAVWVWSRRYPARRLAPPAREPASRPAIGGRLAVVGALVFLVTAGYARLWAVYEQVVLRDPRVRLWIGGRSEGTPAVDVPETPRDRQWRLASSLLDSASLLAARGDFAAARQAYIRALNAFEALSESHPRGRNYGPSRALGYNNLAWMLATCEDLRFRDPEEAVALARRALRLVPDDGNAWNTLAVALYRLGETREALAAFDRSMRLRDGGDGYDWFFLAMIDKARSRDSEARRWYDRAAAWRSQARPFDREALRFHAEAAEALGLPPPEPPKPDADGLDPSPVPLMRRPAAF